MSSASPESADSAKAAGGRFRLSISRTLTLGLALLFIISLGTSLWIALDAAQRNTFDLQRTLAELTVDSVVSEVDTHLGAAKKQIGFLAKLIAQGEVALTDERRLVDLMIGSLAAAPQVSGIALVRPDYSALRVGRQAGELVLLNDSWADRPGIREAMADVLTLNDPSWRAISWVEDFQAPHIVLAEPVMRDDQVLGLFFSIVSVSALSSFLERFDQENEIHSYILYGRDQVLAHPALATGYGGLSPENPLPLLGAVSDIVLASIWNDAVDDMESLLTGSSISGHVVRGAEDDYIYLYRELDLYGPTPWLIGVYFLSHEVNLPLRRLAVAAGLGVAILIVAIVFGLLLGRSIARPLTRLAAASQAVQRLELTQVPALGGSRFSELDSAGKAFDAMVAALRWFEIYVPKRLVSVLMRSGGSSVKSEEREVTVLFTDIAGFTRIGGQLSPTALADLLNAHFSSLAEAIEAEEGTVDKYIGDSIMAFWGAPLDQPDHAERACRAALAIVWSVRAENQRRRAAGEEPLGLRVGVHSGRAIVGNIGAPGRVNYTLIGDTVNAAQRLEALGKEVAPEADAVVLISLDTQASLTPALACDSVGQFVLRGRDGLLEVFRLRL